MSTDPSFFPLRLVAALLLGLVGFFCFYGLMASFEPGDHLKFQIGYTCIGLICFGSASWLGYSGFHAIRPALAWAVCGLFVGFGTTFFVIWAMYLADTPDGFLRYIFMYAVASGPIGAVLGAAKIRGRGGGTPS
ncbi:MAG: hypothetical protein ACYTGQ_00425 [Planctomycetota bacterium]|jgi:hypothetical protein